MRPTTILHVAETAKGGVGSYLEELVPRQAERHGADRVRVVLPAEHAALFDRLPPHALHVFEIGRAGRLRSMVRMARVVLALVRQWRPEVVHLHSSYAGLMLRPLLALLPQRPRVVYCSHGWAFDREAARWLNVAVAAVERTWARFCDAVVCISQHDRASALRAGLPADRLVVVLNGIADISTPADAAVPQEPWPDGTLRVLFVGRLDRQKGVDVLYAALDRLQQRAFAVVVGEAVVADPSHAPPAPRNARAMGWLARGRIAELCRAADVLVVPSRWEGFGLVALEAMRCGCAVVASRTGGLPEVVEHGVTGLLFESGAADELAARLQQHDRAAWKAMGAEGRRRYEARFRIERVCDELDALYRHLIERAPACSARPKPQA
ncbi:MAG: glycosyltransferase [Burkholderiaceae bacterium]|nr:glycosyltransferase [Burkholderiaceae bacterium]